jgi:hypothetical protein
MTTRTQSRACRYQARPSTHHTTEETVNEQPTAITDQQLDEIDARAATLYEYVEMPDEGDILAGTDVPALLAEIRRLRARTLTESEYNSAWHAVEGAAGEEGADPGTVLHAVLNRLGITVPGTGEQPAVAVSEACGKCKQPFDPDDTSFDGRARYHLTPYCRGCVDRCHDNESADHRCVICA